MIYNLEKELWEDTQINYEEGKNLMGETQRILTLIYNTWSRF